MGGPESEGFGYSGVVLTAHITPSGDSLARRVKILPSSRQQTILEEAWNCSYSLRPFAIPLSSTTIPKLSCLLKTHDKLSPKTDLSRYVQIMSLWVCIDKMRNFSPFFQASILFFQFFNEISRYQVWIIKYFCEDWTKYIAHNGFPFVLFLQLYRSHA